MLRHIWVLYKFSLGLCSFKLCAHVKTLSDFLLLLIERVCELHALMPAGGAEQLSLEETTHDWIRELNKATSSSTSTFSAAAAPAPLALFGGAQPHPPQKSRVSPLEARLHQRFGFTHWAGAFSFVQ